MQKEKPKAYIVKMNGLNVQIDQDEVGAVFEGILKGQPIKVRRGLINPSYYIGIVEDQERIKNYLEEVNQIISNNKNYDVYKIGWKQPIPEFQKLSDIFDGIKLPSGRKPWIAEIGTK